MPITWAGQIFSCMNLFCNETRVLPYYLEWTPQYFERFITSEYCMLMHLYAVPHQKLELLTKP